MKVLVVGAGTAGVTLALRVLKQNENVSVSMIDAGPRVMHQDRRVWLDYVARSQLGERKNRFDPYAHLRGQKSDQDDYEKAVLNLFESRYFAVGGSTNAWGGWCVRYRKEDFHLKSATGYGADWPFGLDVLEPYYSKAEETLWVAGESKPNPPLPYTLKDGVIIEALESLGIEDYEHLPLARKANCITIGTCRYCPVGMRYEPTQDLADLESSYAGRFELISSTSALGLEMSSKSVCSGVHVVSTEAGAATFIEADIVVLAAGAVETPKILLSSKSKNWLDGVGNGNGHVGRHITAHPLVRVVGFRPNNFDNLEQPVDFPTLACRAFDTQERQKIGKLFFVRDGRRNATNIEEELLSGKTLAQVRNQMKDQMPFELRGFIEVFSHPDNYVCLGSGTTGYGTPTTMVNFSKKKETNTAIECAEEEMKNILRAAGCEDPQSATYNTVRADHATSTCRMSEDPADGVVDQDLLVHGTENLFVCSNAALPNGAAVNPTLTLIALTERLAETIAGRC